MPHRGINFNFEPHEVVLCFEPDPSKAKVLYYAKILEQCIGNKDRHGRRKPEYKIHFQGWNSSWDRIVPENFVLKNDDTNRALMRHLAGIARQVKRNKTRRRRIDEVLKKHFKRRRRLHSDSESTDSEDSDDEEDSEEGHMETDILEDEEHEEQEEEDEEDDCSESLSSHVTGETTDLNDLEEEEEEEEEPQQIDLDIPENLRKKLEDDCLNIKLHNKLVHLPASYNVVTLLEGYVKSFAINAICATGEKNRNNNQMTPPEKNIGICKEFVDGVRVMFDFTLPKLLLYPAEKTQHDKVMQQPYTHTTHTHEEEDTEEEEEDTEEDKEVVLRSRSQRRSSQRGSLSTPPASSPKLPCLWPSAGGKETQHREEHEDEEDEEEEAPRRRMTRHAYQEEVKKRDHSGGSGGGRATRSSTGASKHEAAALLSERVTPPPPLLLPSHIISSHTAASQASTPPAAAAAAAAQQNNNDSALPSKETAVNDIFSWRLLKHDFYESGEPRNTPCTIYGAHHLLRLFVKLPDILSKMHLPDTSLKHLRKHMELFMEFLSAKSDELFPDSVYVEAADF